jgi:hypothetical protein
MRILHLPTSVGGNSWHLSRGERELGCISDVLVAYEDLLKYPADISLRMQHISAVEKFIRRSACFLTVRNKYDVFHFNFGTSLIHNQKFRLNLLDLPFYPKSARLFVTYNGCDIRQKDVVVRERTIAACHNPLCYGGMCNDGVLDNWRRISLKKMATYVSHIWALNPDLLHFLPPDKSTFLPYAISGSERSPCAVSLNGRLKIVHAPTNREAKGSAFLFSALDRLRLTHGDCFELLLVEGVPHAKALEMYRAADVVVDQLLIGWYGGVAVETMLLGKPVIARIERQDLKFIPREMADDLSDALLKSDPEHIYSTLAWCVENRSKLNRVAEAGFEYARRWHDPKYVASITLAAYEK